MGRKKQTPEYYQLVKERDNLVISWAEQDVSVREMVARLKRDPRFNGKVGVGRKQLSDVIRSRNIAPKQTKERHEADRKKIEKMTRSDGGCTREEAAKAVGMSVSGMKKLIEGMDLKFKSARVPGEVKRKNDKKDGLPDNIDDILRMLYVDYKLTIKEVVARINEKYGTKKSTQWVRLRGHAGGWIRSTKEAQKLASSNGRRPVLGKIDVPTAVEDIICDLYDRGENEAAIRRFLVEHEGYEHPSIVRRVLVENDRRPYTQRESIRLSRVVNFIQIPFVRQIDIAQDYDNGDSRAAISRRYGYSSEVIRRVLVDLNVKIRTNKDRSQIAKEKAKARRRAKKLQPLNERITRQYRDIRRSMLSHLQSGGLSRYFRGRRTRRVIDEASSYILEVAARWRPQPFGDNFLWFVSKYALMTYYDMELRPRQKTNQDAVDKQQSIKSLNAGVQTYRGEVQRYALIADERAEPPSAKNLIWEETKEDVIAKVRSAVRRKELHRACLPLIEDYYLPLVETGSPRYTITRLGKRLGLSESRVSQINTGKPFRDLLRDVLVEVAD